MIRRGAAFGLTVLVFVLVTGCEGGRKGPRNEKVLIEKAKSDFLAGVRGSFDFATGILETVEDIETSSADQLGDLEITGGRIFDYVRLPRDEKCWAVELEFIGRDLETNEEKQGVAILQYGNFIVNGDMQEGELMFVHTGTTGQQIKNIKKAAQVSSRSFSREKSQAFLNQSPASSQFGEFLHPEWMTWTSVQGV